MTSIHSRPISFLRLLAVVTLPLYLLDQATKVLILRTMEYGDQRPVIAGFFDLVRAHNTGAAFSMFTDSNNFFIAISCVALVVLAVLAWRGLFQERAGRFAWALLLAGIVGNLTDRILHGYVVDFLSFDLHLPYANPWPSFNVADSCICLAAGLFMWESFQEERRKRHS